MFDTIGIRFLNYLPEPFLERWDKKDNQKNSYENDFKFGNSNIHAMYHKFGFVNNKPMLNLYTSLPKLVHECNHTMITMAELPEAFAIMNKYIQSIPEFSNLEVEKARLVRVDACHNFKVGDDLHNYLHVAKGVDVSRRKKVIFQTGVHHKSDEHTLTAYIKYLLCKHPEAKGLFRIENQLKSSALVKKVIGEPNPKLTDLNKDLANRLINSALHDLKLDKYNAYNLPETKRRIIQDMGATALARNIIHYVEDKNQLDPQNLQALYNRATKRNYEIKLSEIGLISTAIEEDKLLPPLSIV